MTEARFSFTTKVNNDLFTVRGDTIDEFVSNLEESVAAVTAVNELQEATRGVAAVVAAVPEAQVVSTNVTPTLSSAPSVAPTGAVETETDNWLNVWTYNLPDAPDLPDGRGKYALAKRKSKKGEWYTKFVDPYKGPKPFPAPAGGTVAPELWPPKRGHR